MSTKKKAAIGSINWRDLTVRDATAVSAFYSAVVGWKIVSLDMGGYNDSCMNVILSSAPPGEVMSMVDGMPAGGRSVVCFQPVGTVTSSLSAPGTCTVNVGASDWAARAETEASARLISQAKDGRFMAGS